MQSPVALRAALLAWILHRSYVTTPQPPASAASERGECPYAWPRTPAQSPLLPRSAASSMELEHTDKTHKWLQHKAGQAHVGPDDGPMRQNIRIEHQQRQSNQRRFNSKHLPRRKKHQNCQQQREQHSRHARPEENRLGIIAEDEVLPSEKRFMLELAILERGHL